MQTCVVVDMSVDMRVGDVCVDMCVHISVDMCADICADMCVDICADMYAIMCTDVPADMLASMRQAELLRGIASVGGAVERAMGSAQDVEGCFVGGKYFVVQTRPQV